MPGLAPGLLFAVGSDSSGPSSQRESRNPPQRAAQCRLELPGSLSSNSAALTGNSARRAGGNSPRRSGRRPGLRREPAPGSARSSFARFGESAHAHGEPLQVRAFEAGVFAALSCPPFSCSDATARPRVCVQILSSCSYRRGGASRAALFEDVSAATAIGGYAAKAQQFGFDSCTKNSLLGFKAKYWPNE